MKRRSLLGVRRPSSRTQTRHRHRPLLEPCEPRVLLATVTTALDNGSNNSPFPGSLRDAINQVNNAGDTTITFASDFNIELVGEPLRPITNPVSFNAGELTRNVVINGSMVNPNPDGTPADGLVLNTNDSVVQGLTIREFAGNGIVVLGANNTIGGASDSEPGAGPTTQQFSAMDLPQRIPPFGTGGSDSPGTDTTFSKIEVEGLTSPITDVNVNLTLTHTFVRDLNITLVSPSGVRVALAMRRGGGGSNYTNTTFDDQAPTPIANGFAPFNDSFRPEQPLSAFNGQIANGDWLLEVQDVAALDTGSLLSFTLTIGTGSVSPIQGREGNLIIANRGVGILIVGAGASGNKVLGNDIRTNGLDGIRIEDAPNNVIGGAEAGEDRDPGVPQEMVFTQSAMDLPQRIPLFGSGGSDSPGTDTTVSTINVPVLNAPITDVNVNLSLTHTFVGDLIITLVSPNGRRVVLSRNNGGGGDNYTNTTFDDQATRSITGGVAPFTGSFRPEQPLSAFNGEIANGTWRLEVQDVAALDTGSLLSFTLTIGTGSVSPIQGREGNLIIGNSGSGVLIVGAGATGNILLGNEIQRNQVDGVRVEDASNNRIGNVASGPTVPPPRAPERFIINQPAMDLPRRIPPFGTGGSDSPPGLETTRSFITIENVQPDARISDVNVNLTLTHFFVGDLVINLVSPDGRRVVLSRNNGGSEDNYTNTTFDDQAAQSITSGFAPFTGLFRPEQSLSSLNGSQVINGIWTLEVEDQFAFDTGDLLSFTLTIEAQAQAPSQPGTPVNMTVGNRVFVNQGHGVAIVGAGATGNLVQANFIERNLQNGVLVQDAPGNLIGGASLESGNVMFNNRGHGVAIRGAGATGNLVQANFIDFNDLDGVLVQDAPGNLIGGANLESGNLIVRNRDGMAIVGIGATGNRVQANFIERNLQNGVLVQDAPGNLIGGASVESGNLISDNRANGVLVFGFGATGNLVQANFIDFNGQNGVLVQDAPGNTIGGAGLAFRNSINDNVGNGVAIVGAGAAGNVVSSNDILSNSRSGVSIRVASFNTIGGINPLGSPEARVGNYIGGNELDGVSIEGTGEDRSTFNFVQGNLIGISPENRAFGNRRNGVLVESSEFNFIGGSEEGARNVISANRNNGIEIAFSFSTFIQNNFIGSDNSGQISQVRRMEGQITRLGNANQGIFLNDAFSTFVGGTDPSMRNVILGSGGSGITIGLGQANLIEGNYIGIEVTGQRVRQEGDNELLLLGNFQDGISLFRTCDNTIGGVVLGARNVISGNQKNGLSLIDNARNNVILGNFIGTNAAGDEDHGNNLNGIFLNAPNNFIGGITAAAGNVISGNDANGVVIAGIEASNNLVAANFIGTDVSGTVGIGNSQSGIFINNAFNNLIGLEFPEAGNVISGNQADGVHIFGPLATNNVVVNNRIGTDITGNQRLGNGANGIFLNNSRGNRVGGVLEGQRNIISANGGSGIEILGQLNLDNQSGELEPNRVYGNYIGTNRAGTAPLGNSTNGIFLNNSPNNHIGEEVLGAGNVISGNNAFGVLIGGRNARDNRVVGNFIGTDFSGTARLGNSFDGIAINNASGNFIGGTNDVIDGTITFRRGGNVISSNGGHGVHITGASPGNLIVGNLIGTDFSGNVELGNNGSGIRLEINPNPMELRTTIVLGNVLSGNNAAGVEIAGLSTNVVVLGNRIGTNAAGNARLDNNTGVFINDAVGNTIGGLSVAERNIISGNRSIGVQVFRVTPVEGLGNQIVGNYIGTDASGRVALGNGPGRAEVTPANFEIGVGIFLNNAPNNLIDRNIISGNNFAGVVIFGRLDRDNNVTVGNNIIGGNLEGGPLMHLDTPSAESRAAQQDVGVLINASRARLRSRIDTVSRGNQVVGNIIVDNIAGVEVVGVPIADVIINPPPGSNVQNREQSMRPRRNDAHQNLVAGNNISRNQTGVFVNNSAQTLIQANTIFENSAIGVAIVGAAAVGNRVEANPAINQNLVGVFVDRAVDNFILNNQINSPRGSGGQPGRPVPIGVLLNNGATRNLVEGNTIRGGDYGIFLFNSSGNLDLASRSRNTFSGNAIAQFREFTGPVPRGPGQMMQRQAATRR
ncbi:hypothetical protein BH23PLA1_BH23PLA1_20250 [soil metagenome]